MSSSCDEKQLVRLWLVASSVAFEYLNDDEESASRTKLRRSYQTHCMPL